MESDTLILKPQRDGSPNKGRPQVETLGRQLPVLADTDDDDDDAACQVVAGGLLIHPRVFLWILVMGPFDWGHNWYGKGPWEKPWKGPKYWLSIWAVTLVSPPFRLV